MLFFQYGSSSRFCSIFSLELNLDKYLSDLRLVLADVIEIAAAALASISTEYLEVVVLGMPVVVSVVGVVAGVVAGVTADIFWIAGSHLRCEF